MRDDVSLSGRQIVASSFTRRWWFVFWVIISLPPYLFALISFPYFIPTVQRTPTCIWSIARIDYARDPFSSLFFLFCIQYSKSILFFFFLFFLNLIIHKLICIFDWFFISFFCFWVAALASIVGTSELYVRTGSTISLTCIIQGSGSIPPRVLFWFHNSRPSK